MTDLYVPYCQNKTKSEDLLAGHRSYLTVSQSDCNWFHSVL